jgi:Zn-dependent M16 (insulinase) family peptidase
MLNLPKLSFLLLDVNSNFLTLSVNFFPTKLPVHLRPLLYLYLSSFFSLPLVLPDGTRLGFEEVVKRLDAGTVEYGIDLGAYMHEAATAFVKVEKSKYGQGIAWLRDLLWSSEFDLDRLKTIATKLSQSLPTEKRDGNGIARAAFNRLVYDSTKSNSIHMNVLSRAEYIKTLLERIETDPQALQSDLEQLRLNLLDPSTLRVSVSGDILSLDKPSKAWSENFRAIETRTLEPVVTAHDVLSHLGRHPKQLVTIYTLPSIESSFAVQGTKGPDRWDHPDIAAIRVTASFLNSLEGPLWKFIRGAGLVCFLFLFFLRTGLAETRLPFTCQAYGSGVSVSVESGLITFRVYRSPNSAKAFLEGEKVMKELADGKVRHSFLSPHHPW